MRRSLWVSWLAVFSFSQSEPPDTEIIQPKGELHIVKGQSFHFMGNGIGPEGLSYAWEFCADFDACLMTGQEVDFSFEEAGIYEVICYASNQGLEDPTPARVTVHVYDQNVMPRINIQEPPLRDSVAYVGDTVYFRCEATDEDDNSPSVFWTFAHDPNFRVDGLEMNYQIPAAGTYVISSVVTDDSGQQSRDYRIVRAYSRQDGVPPLPRITFPADGAAIMSGESISLDGEVIDPDSSDATVSWLISDGRRFDGTSVPSISFSRPGRYTISMIASDSRGSRTTSVKLYVVSSLDSDTIQIAQPATDLRLQPGDPLFLEGTSDNSSIYDKFFRWELVQTDGPGHHRLHLSTPGNVYLEEGEWDITLFATHPAFENQLYQSEPRHVVVKPTTDSEFRNNNTLQTAATIVPGNYRNQMIAADEYFAFSVNAGQTIILEVNTPQAKTMALEIGLLDAQGNEIEIIKTTDKSSIRHTSDRTGVFKMRARETSDSGYPKRPLDFGFGLTVLNPALYFPDVHWSDHMGSRLVIVNPFEESISMELVGYNTAGSQIGSVSLDLVAKGRLSAYVDEIFGSAAPLVSWLRVDATKAVGGICISETRDGLEAYAVSGSTALSRDLYIPHVAQATTQWYTRGVVANGYTEPTSSVLMSEAPPKMLDFSQPHSKIDFDFVELFGGSLPAGVAWGTFVESAREMKLAAVEVFGKKDGSRQVAGLTLSDARQDNPNFFFIKQNLYFTHIARDTAQFWTGIALVNVGMARRSYIVYAYDSAGKVVGQQVRSVDTGQKIVQLAADFLDGVADVTSVDWVMIEADEGLVGYELFGTLDNKRLAGMEAGTGLKESICMPFIDQSLGYWYGISIVNVGTSNADVTFTLYDAGGNVLNTKSQRLSPKQKYVNLLATIFGTLPSNAAWVECSSSGGRLTGFQLFGDPTFERMAAILAL